MADEKIKAEEILDDSELNQVAGGTIEETFKAVALLKEKCGIILTDVDDYDHVIKSLTEKYAQVGIKFQDVDMEPNKYTDIKTGKALSHEEAVQILINGFKK